jgi:hypothetical protein
MPPYPPAGNISLHQPRQEPPPPHPHHSGGMPPYPMHSFRPDAPMGPFETGGHRPPPAHPMEHMAADRMPYSYGCEQGGPRPFLEQPSPRTWASEVNNLEGLSSKFVNFCGVFSTRLLSFSPCFVLIMCLFLCRHHQIQTVKLQEICLMWCHPQILERDQWQGKLNDV